MKDGALITISKFNYDTPIIVPLWVFFMLIKDSSCQIGSWVYPDYPS